MKTILALLFAFLAPLMAKESSVELLATLERSFQQRSTKFPKADSEALDGEDRDKALLNLRYLLEMEAVLREMSNDGASLKKQVDIEDFSSSEKKRTIELRAEANAYRVNSLTSPNFEEPRTSPVEKLHKAFERKAKKLLTNIAKSRKTLNREYDRNRPDDRVVDRLEKEIAGFEDELAKIRTAFFGNVPRKGFEAPFDGSSEKPVDELLAETIKARDQLLKTLRLDPKAPGPKDGGIKKGEVGGIKVRSSNLGVILDNSGSMQPHIPELRKEIDRGFPGSHYREVYGCALTWRAGPTKLGTRDLVLLAMEDLIIVKKADALYWFSDLRDPQSEAGLFQLGELLQSSGALFYVSSVDRKPEDELEDLITEFKKK